MSVNIPENVFLVQSNSHGNKKEFKAVKNTTSANWEECQENNIREKHSSTILLSEIFENLVFPISPKMYEPSFLF